MPVTSETANGTPVLMQTPDEYARYVAAEVSRGIGMTPEQFVRAYGAGELDDSDPAVSDLVMLLRIGQNGRHAAR